LWSNTAEVEVSDEFIDPIRMVRRADALTIGGLGALSGKGAENSPPKRPFSAIISQAQSGGLNRKRQCTGNDSTC
jgi:hypothetical protein